MSEQPALKIVPVQSQRTGQPACKAGEPMSSLPVNPGGIILMGAITRWFRLSSPDNGQQNDHNHH
ncbi:MAG TPA: hypothetical protein DHU56_16800 [Marinobacter sp.]|jgi:hypothetical protein|uniref:hypothetical protein n=1 Tax=Marinobacter sp. TaxID=50741 RepID=UPI000EC2D750|nr:hypothetical protein [Marinobacter sp.]MBC7191087.1 hypothetical protein [Marinobacter sp.]HCW91688.1 hypothetical protein [Marinobacter sp.]